MAIFWVLGILAILISAVLIRIGKRSRGGQNGFGMEMRRMPPLWILLMITGVFLIVYSTLFGV